ncbi:hypothetical protein V8F20_000486 [Naviculisporaceae sp. PSN 640]
MPNVPFDNVRIIVLIFLIFLVFAGPDTSTPLISTGPSGAGSRLDRQRQALDVLNETKWGDHFPDKSKRYLNLTGFREDDGYAWEDLARFRNRCHEWSRNAFSRGHLVTEPGAAGWGEREEDWEKGPEQITWLNATGTVFGEWVRRSGTVERHSTNYNLSAIAPGLGWPTGHTEWDRNITGKYGTVLVRLGEDAENMEYEEKGEEGRQPRSSDLVRQVSAQVEFQDVDSGSSNFDMRLYGVHWPRQGAILLSTTSEKFAGIFGLPHLAPGEGFFNSSQQLLNKTINDVLERREKAWSSDPNSPWTSEISGVEDPWSLTPHCEYVMYLQLASIEPTIRGGFFSEVDEIENELRHPTGAPVGKLPNLRMSLVAWSPDCSFFIESKGPPHYAAVDGRHLVGMKAEILNFRASRWTLTFGAVLLGQLWLLKTQMREANTPSTIGRVSFYTASMTLLADGVVFSSALFWSLSAITSLLPTLVVTFASFMLMIMGGTFLSEVYKTQEPERRSRERRANITSGGATSPSTQPENNTTGPQAVTTGPPRPESPPIIIPSDQDIDAEIAEATASGASAVPGVLPAPVTAANNTNNRPPRAVTTSSTNIIGRILLLGTLLLFLTAASSSWPARIRAFYINAVAFLYFSLWIPQVYRNVIRNSRRAFSWRYMVGQSGLRLIPFAYFYMVEDNFLFAKTDARTFAILCGWVWAQLCVLSFQDVLGPRFGVPRGWLPEAWDYHPVLKEDNIESGLLPIGLVGDGGSERTRSWSIGQSSGSGSGSGSHRAEAGTGESSRERDKERERSGISMRCIDCAICREVLEVPVVKAGAGEPASISGVAGVLARREYMVTPCRHIFHTKCLDGWLKFRLQCPICREELPPL